MTLLHCIYKVSSVLFGGRNRHVNLEHVFNVWPVLIYIHAFEFVLMSLQIFKEQQYIEYRVEYIRWIEESDVIVSV